MFWITLSRYVAVILYDSIYRIKLPSCEPYKGILSSLNLETSQKSQETISSAVPSPLFSPLTGLFCFFVPHLHFTNIIFYSLFTRNPNPEEQIADQLGIARKEYHGKSFEGRQCSKLFSCSASLKEVVPSSDAPLVECLEAFHRVVVGVSAKSQIQKPKIM